MGMNDTPSSERMHIAFFGLRNAGKSSLVNAVTGQNMAIVSDVRGTTTDPVYKSMELLPMGPVVIIDTPGIDDEGNLGEMRVRKTKEVLTRTDVAVLVTDGSRERQPEEEALLALFREKAIPYVIAENKKDLVKTDFLPAEDRSVRTECRDRRRHPGAEGTHRPYRAEGRTEGKTDCRRPGSAAGPGGTGNSNRCLRAEGPPDPPSAAGDSGPAGGRCRAGVRQGNRAGGPPGKTGIQTGLVITDSQAFRLVSEIVPEDIPLTSFSILMLGTRASWKLRCRGFCHRRGEAGGHHPDFRGMYPPSPVRGHRNGETAEAPAEASGL